MIEINWPLLITQVATFLAAMFVVWKFSWGPLTKMMNDRTQKIQDDIDQAARGKNAIEAWEADLHQQLSEIEEKARQEINNAIAQGHQEKEAILKEAQNEAQRILEKNREMLVQERQQVIKELREHVTEIALKAIEQLVGEKADEQVHTKMLNNFMDDLEKVEK